jgi:hypothetical protein
MLLGQQTLGLACTTKGSSGYVEKSRISQGER